MVHASKSTAMFVFFLIFVRGYQTKHIHMFENTLWHWRRGGWRYLTSGRFVWGAVGLTNNKHRNDDYDNDDDEYIYMNQYYIQCGYQCLCSFWRLYLTSQKRYYDMNNTRQSLDHFPRPFVWRMELQRSSSVCSRQAQQCTWSIIAQLRLIAPICFTGPGGCPASRGLNSLLTK